MNTDCKFADLSTGVRLAYVEQGPRDGLPVILLHGISDTLHSYDLVRPLLPTSWRVFAVTVRGHGLSDKPATGYGMDDFASDVAAFMDAVGVERAIVVGHSMSSAITLATAAAYPERVAGVVLLGAFAHFDTEALQGLKEAVADIGDTCGREFAKDFQESTLANPIPPDYLETVINESLYMPGYAWRGAVQGLIDFEPVDAARRILAPAAIIWGEKDQYCPRQDQHDLRAALRNSRLFTLTGVGHALHWERPADTAALLRAFIADIEEPAVLTHAFA
ncbi:MAG TPA: alpha/beta hydrolase [Vitreimonas sp.]|nr:alpha/beta hydrolase [Vitreimonas sp.]